MFGAIKFIRKNVLKIIIFSQKAFNLPDKSNLGHLEVEIKEFRKKLRADNINASKAMDKAHPHTQIE